MITQWNNILNKILKEGVAIHLSIMKYKSVKYFYAILIKIFIIHLGPIFVFFTIITSRRSNIRQIHFQESYLLKRKQKQIGHIKKYRV